MNIPPFCTDFVSLSVHLKYWLPAHLKSGVNRSRDPAFSIILLKYSLTYTDIAGGRKARTYEIWILIQALAINRRRGGRVYPRPYENLITSG